MSSMLGKPIENDFVIKAPMACGWQNKWEHSLKFKGEKKGECDA